MIDDFEDNIENNINNIIYEIIEDIENNKVKNFIDVIDPKKWFNFHLQKLL